MGKVYSAYDTRLSTYVAIYVLDPARRTDKGISDFLVWVRNARRGQADVVAPCEQATLPVVDFGVCGDVHFAVLMSARSETQPSDSGERRGRPTRG